MNRREFLLKMDEHQAKLVARAQQRFPDLNEATAGRINQLLKQAEILRRAYQSQNKNNLFMDWQNLINEVSVPLDESPLTIALPEQR
ncbi:MAG: hypothetical protein H7338_12335 [Candidatus Sericytochromatia bacterium]|nr:hypothetical protein [Candidatus Sericytochromatia bacterium]